MGAYEDTLEEIMRTFGVLPSFMKVFTTEKLVREWPSWKKDNLGEIDLERAGYFLSTDEILEEILSETKDSAVQRII
ncbi:MAG: hypothetical protein O8C55_13960 [Candidatus Methanoperedens sp.]|nr:hypothetical protein [Candidatus Methanoperedens sp.]